jgi:ADP-heptose:LPS heptosyltransferase
VKWKIYQKALSLKFINYRDEALKMIKLIQLFLTQHLKWIFLHLKLLAIKKEWNQIEEEKYNLVLVPENQIYSDTAALRQITDIFNLMHERKFKDKKTYE